MSIIHFDIDTIVRRVMADLLPQQADVSRAPQVKSENGKSDNKIENNKTENKPKQESQSTNQKETVRLDGHLITLALLDERIQGRWENVREMIVPAKAVITPSVRDLCYKKEITLTFHSENVMPNQTPNANQKEYAAEKLSENVSVLLALHQIKREPEMLLNFLRQDTLLEKESFDCIIKTVEHTAKQMEQNTNQAAIIISHHYAAAGIVLANRYAKLRAVYGIAPEQVKHDAAATDANVLILPAEQLSGYQLREISRAFLANKMKLPNRATNTISHSNNTATANSITNAAANNIVICPEKLLQAFSERGTK